MKFSLARVVALQEKLYRDNEGLIRSRLAPENIAQRRYRRAATFPAVPPRRCSDRKMWAAAKEADITVVGDHFFTPFGKEVALQWLRGQHRAGRRPALIVAALNAREVSLFLQSADPARLQVALGRGGRWGRRLPLRSFSQFFAALASQPVEVYGADPHRPGLFAKDRAVVALAAQLRRRDRKRPLLILAGEMRARPGALPRALRRTLPQDRVVSLAVNPAQPYFAYLRRHRERPRCLRLAADDFACWSASPLISQQIFVDWAYGEEQWFDPRHCTEAVEQAARRICRWFGVQPPKRLPRLYCCADEAYFSRLARARLSRETRHLAWQQIAAGQSWTIPHFPHLCLATPSYTHLGEELTHWLRLKAVKEPELRGRYDLFLRTAWHEALGFWGSRVCGSRRSAPPLAEVVKALGLSRHRGTAGRRSLLGRFFRPEFARQVNTWSPRRLHQAAHWAGYYWGGKMWPRLCRQPLAKRRALFLAGVPRFFMEAARG